MNSTIASFRSQTTINVLNTHIAGSNFFDLMKAVPTYTRDPVALASIYRISAVNFWESAKKIDASLEKKSDGSPAKITAVPYYFLVSHATELFLKSALLKRGFTESDLMQYKIRHDLNALLSAVRNKGLIVSQETTDIINGLHAAHKTQALRYDVLLRTGRTYWPPTSLIDSMLEELLLLTKISAQGR